MDRGYNDAMLNAAANEAANIADYFEKKIIKQERQNKQDKEKIIEYINNVVFHEVKYSTYSKLIDLIEDSFKPYQEPKSEVKNPENISF